MHLFGSLQQCVHSIVWTNPNFSIRLLGSIQMSLGEVAGGGGVVVDQVVDKEGDRDANKVAMLLNN